MPFVLVLSVAEAFQEFSTDLVKATVVTHHESGHLLDDRSFDGCWLLAAGCWCWIIACGYWIVEILSSD